MGKNFIQVIILHYYKLLSLVHGNWGDWQAGSTGWGDDECPVGCGGATQNRTRACDNPAPQFGGEECPVEGVDGPSDYETRTCNDGTCPGKPYM